MMAKRAEPSSPVEVAEFQRREWAVQRSGWVLLWALLAAAAAGLFGRGPLAQAHVIAAAGWRVDFERFARKHTPTQVVVMIPPTAGGSDTTSLWLDRGYADAVEFQQILPEPVGEAVSSDRLVYRFLIDGSRPVRFVFEVEPERTGRLRGRLGLVGGDSVSFTQLVYP
jgi:hypothetical protein